MKKIRKCNKIVTPNKVHSANGTNGKFFPGRFESMPERYRQLILPPDRKNQVSYWPKRCEIKPDGVSEYKMVNEDLMCWKLKNWYGLICDDSTEERSTISTLNVCSINDVIRILFEWCKGTDVESIAHMLGISKPTVNGLYMRASDVVNKFMRLNINDWQIGGPEVIVIIDIYPEGCANTNQLRMGRPLLCISEVKSIPQKYWMEALNDFDRNDVEQIKSIKEHILHTVRTVILPGSILITPFTSTLCHYSDFECLRTLYPTIVSVGDLTKHDNGQQNICANLETIWKTILDVCEEAQFYNSRYIEQFIINHMWRRRYADRSFEMLLHQLSLRQ